MAQSEIIRCAHCGAANRVPLEKLQAGAGAICGRCKSPLALVAEPLTVTDATFAAEVEGSQLPVLVDMWAPWCGPCRAVGPVIDALAKDLTGRIRVAKMNVDENPLTSERFQIQSIPALLMFKGGREIDRILGAQPKGEILRRLERLTA